MRAAAEDDGADGASGAGIGNGNVAAAGFFFRRHVGNEGDAHAGADHAEQTGKLAAFENDLRADAGAVARGDGIFAETVAIAKEKERFLADVFERNGTAVSEFVFLREDGEERFGEEGEGFEFVAANGNGKNGNVDGGGAETIEEDGSDFLDDGEPRLRKFFRKGGEDARKQIRRDGGNGADGDGATDGTFLFDDVASGGFEFAEDAAGAREKGFADVGEADGAAETIEKTSTQFVFELEDLLGERGLRDVGLLGGTGEGTGVGDGAKVAELVKFDKAAMGRGTSVLRNI